MRSKRQVEPILTDQMAEALENFGNKVVEIAYSITTSILIVLLITTPALALYNFSEFLLRVMGSY